MSSASDSELTAGQAGIVSKTSHLSVAATVSRLLALVESKGMKVFAVIDHSAEATHVGLALRDTKVVLFGSPLAGTPVMSAHPLAALDLPLRVLIWDDKGQTTVSYTAPDALASRYAVAPALAANLAGINALTDALVSV
jgi:uncharacterized protein (DUF302 family)